MKKSDKVYLNHILESLQAIIEYTDGLNKQDFFQSRLVQDAVVRNFEIIGEATKNLSNDFRSKHEHIPWKKMAGMRDKLIHQYMGVDLDAVWNTIDGVLPKLKNEIENILDNSES